MNDVTLYDTHGEPFAYLDEEDTIYLFSGQAVAYLEPDASIYAFSGKHLGRFEVGWIWDHYGRAVLFTEDAHDEPYRPNIRHSLPKKAVKLMKPYKHPREKPVISVTRSTSWSKMSGQAFFQLEV